MRAMLAAAIIAVLVAPAYAKDAKTERDLEKKRSEELDRAYKNTLKNTAPAAQPVSKTDPWSNARTPAPEK